MADPRQFPMPGVKPAQSKRAVSVVDWIANMRADVVDTLREARSALNEPNPTTRAVAVRRITALLERIEGTV